MLRANAIGDFVLTLPALEAVRNAYPHAHLALLGTSWHASFLAGRPGPVDETICLPAIPGVTAPANAPRCDPAVARFLHGMRGRRFDLALQLHGGGAYSNPLVLALGARVTAGFRAPDAAPLDRNFPYIQSSVDLHPRIHLLLECAGLVGARAVRAEPRISLTEADERELQARLPDIGGRLAVLQPGARDPRRCWSAARFAQVGDALAASGMRILIHGGPGEQDLARQVRQTMRRPAMEIAGLLSPGGLCALLARSQILVSNDTGPAHLARALGVPTVTIYWVGNVPAYGPPSVLRHRIAVSYRIHCPVCGEHCMEHDCGHTASFVDDVSADEVITLALSLCAAGPAPSRARPLPVP